MVSQVQRRFWIIIFSTGSEWIQWCGTRSGTCLFVTLIYSVYVLKDLFLLLDFHEINVSKMTYETYWPMFFFLFATHFSDRCDWTLQHSPKINFIQKHNLHCIFKLCTPSSPPCPEPACWCTAPSPGVSVSWWLADFGTRRCTPLWGKQRIINIIYFNKKKIYIEYMCVYI